MTSLADRIERYLDDDAVILVDHYVNSNCFTGRAFETLDTGAGNPPERITADDLLAVAMLAIPIRRWSEGGITPEQVLRLTTAPEVPGWLAAIPTDLALHELDPEQADRHLGEAAPASQLFYWLRGDVGLGVTATFKLLARKRPQLLPVSDTKVRTALATGDAWWMPVWEALHARPDLVERLRDIAARAGAANLGVLRSLDVAVWMRVHGATQCQHVLP